VNNAKPRALVPVEIGPDDHGRPWGCRANDGNRHPDARPRDLGEQRGRRRPAHPRSTHALRYRDSGKSKADGKSMG
jgi:hypothetical protein